MNASRAWIGALLALSSSFAASYEDELKAGMGFHDEGKYDKAIAAYARASALDPANYVPLYEMAYSYSATGARDSAIAYSKASLRQQQKGNDGAFVLLGNLYDDMSRAAQANSVYTFGLRHNPESAQLYYNCSIGRQWIGSESVSRYEYRSHMGAKAIETVAESKTENGMKPFYADFGKKGFQVPLARYAFSGASKLEFAIWAEANAKQFAAFAAWFGQQAQ